MKYMIKTWGPGAGLKFEEGRFFPLYDVHKFYNCACFLVSHVHDFWVIACASEGVTFGTSQKSKNMEWKLSVMALPIVSLSEQNRTTGHSRPTFRVSLADTLKPFIITLPMGD